MQGLYVEGVGQAHPANHENQSTGDDGDFGFGAGGDGGGDGAESG